MTALAPELDTSRWFNARAPLTLADLRGKVVVLHAFQMLCPGCVTHGTPQAEKLHRMFATSGEVAVIGLHTVFEHHAAMTEVALEAFIHEYRLTLPVAVDWPGEDDPIPRTMRRYGMRGTPTTIVIDRSGLNRPGFSGGHLVWVRPPRLARQSGHNSALRLRREECCRWVRVAGDG